MESTLLLNTRQRQRLEIDQGYRQRLEIRDIDMDIDRDNDRDRDKNNLPFAQPKAHVRELDNQITSQDEKVQSLWHA